MSSRLAGVDSAILVEALQNSERAVGRLVTKAAEAKPHGWLPTQEMDDLLNAWRFVLDAECELRARYEALNNETALD